MITRSARLKSRSENTEELEAVADLDFNLSDDSPTAENLALDADLEIGTGLEKGTDMDVAQDFGFAVTTHLDMELPEESANVDDRSETDIIAPPGTDESSILKSEMLPDDDDYDMSVIVDATKMPMPEEVTERDLRAVVVDGGDETLISRRLPALRYSRRRFCGVPVAQAHGAYNLPLGHRRGIPQIRRSGARAG